MDDHHTQIAIAKGSTVIGAGGALGGLLSINEWLAVGGFALAVIGFLVNLYYSWKDDRRKELEHLWRLREMPPSGLDKPYENGM